MAGGESSSGTPLCWYIHRRKEAMKCIDGERDVQHTYFSYGMKATFQHTHTQMAVLVPSIDKKICERNGFPFVPFVFSWGGCRAERKCSQGICFGTSSQGMGEGLETIVKSYIYCPVFVHLSVINFRDRCEEEISSLINQNNIINRNNMVQVHVKTTCPPTPLPPPPTFEIVPP